MVLSFLSILNLSKTSLDLIGWHSPDTVRHHYHLFLKAQRRYYTVYYCYFNGNIYCIWLKALTPNNSQTLIRKQTNRKPTQPRIPTWDDLLSSMFPPRAQSSIPIFKWVVLYIQEIALDQLACRCISLLNLHILYTVSTYVVNKTWVAMIFFSFFWKMT